jgi:short-subunit dehydrogenase
MVWKELAEEINTNMIAPILLTKGVWHIFQKQGHGAIININSLAGKSGGRNEHGYCASKHGLAGFAKALQFDAVAANVRVLTAYIGAMDTHMAEGKGNLAKFIDPFEVAQTLLGLVEQKETLRITEIEILRSQY